MDEQLAQLMLTPNESFWCLFIVDDCDSLQTSGTTTTEAVHYCELKTFAVGQKHRNTAPSS